MSRSGYVDDCEQTWDWIRWRGAVASAIRGKKGQAFIKELLEALEAMPEKRLIEGEWIDAQGEVCAVGCVLKARGIEINADTDVDDYEYIARKLGINEKIVQEIEHENDNVRVFYVGPHVGHQCDALTHWDKSPETRWQIIHQWCLNHLEKEKTQ